MPHVADDTDDGHPALLWTSGPSDLRSDRTLAGEVLLGHAPRDYGNRRGIEGVAITENPPGYYGNLHRREILWACFVGRDLWFLSNRHLGPAAHYEIVLHVSAG